MAITLAESKVSMVDKVDQQVIDEFRRESFLLDKLTFDNAVSPGTGGSMIGRNGIICLRTTIRLDGITWIYPKLPENIICASAFITVLILLLIIMPWRYKKLC